MHTGCFYENSWGGCKGRPKGRITVTPHCFEDEDVEAYNESRDEDAILAYELDPQRQYARRAADKRLVRSVHYTYFEEISRK